MWLAVGDYPPILTAMPYRFAALALIIGLGLVSSTWGAAVDAAQRPAASCDRECLRGMVTQLLYALVKHDVSDLPVASTLRVTEDAVEKPLANVRFSLVSAKP